MPLLTGVGFTATAPLAFAMGVPGKLHVETPGTGKETLRRSADLVGAARSGCRGGDGGLIADNVEASCSATSAMG
jgi:hypothetical protein